MVLQVVVIRVTTQLVAQTLVQMVAAKLDTPLIVWAHASKILFTQIGLETVIAMTVLTFLQIMDTAVLLVLRFILTAMNLHVMAATAQIVVVAVIQQVLAVSEQIVSS